MNEETTLVSQLAWEWKIDKSTARKYLKRLGFDFVRVRGDEPTHQMVLALSDDDAQRARLLRIGDGYDVRPISLFMLLGMRLNDHSDDIQTLSHNSEELLKVVLFMTEKNVDLGVRQTKDRMLLIQMAETFAKVIGFPLDLSPKNGTQKSAEDVFQELDKGAAKVKEALADLTKVPTNNAKK